MQEVGNNLVAVEVSGGLIGLVFDPTVELRQSGKDGKGKSMVVAESAKYNPAPFTVGGSEYVAYVGVYKKLPQAEKKPEGPKFDNSKLMKALK